MILMVSHQTRKPVNKDAQRFKKSCREMVARLDYKDTEFPVLKNIIARLKRKTI